MGCYFVYLAAKTKIRPIILDAWKLLMINTNKAQKAAHPDGLFDFQ